MDFYVKDETGREALVEVKGVTLEEDGTAMFPDAPTERGVKHIRELMGAASSGYVVLCDLRHTDERDRFFQT